MIAAANWQTILFKLLRELRRAAVSISTYRPYGIPVDRILHFFIAGLIFLIVSRWLRKRWALLAAVGMIILKELIDIPMKAGILEHGANLTTDAVWDILCGLAGVIVAYLFVRWRGRRWQARGLGAEASAPRPSPSVELGRPTVRAAAAVSLFLVIFGGLSLMILPGVNWMHPVAAGLAALGAARFGSFRVLLVFLPVFPALNLADYVWTGPHPLAASEPALLAVAAVSLVRIIRPNSGTVRADILDLLVAAFALVSLAAAAIASIQFGPAVSGFAWALRPLEAAAIYFIVSRSAANKRRVLWLCVAVAIGLLGSSIIGIIEFIVRPLQLQIVPGSIFGDAESFGIYLAVAVPLVLALAIWTRGVLRWLCWAAVAPGVACVGLVYSRACWASVAATAPLVVLAWALRRDRVLGIGVLLALAMAGAVGAKALGSAAGPGSSPAFVHEAASIFTPGSLRRARWQAIETATRQIKEAPLTGHPGGWVDQFYLTLAMNHGLPAAALAMLALAVVVWRGAVRSWWIRDPALFGVVAGGVAGVVGALIEGLAEGGYARPGYVPLMWSVIAMVVAARNVARAPASSLAASESAGEPVPSPPTPQPAEPVSTMRVRPHHAHRAAEPSRAVLLLILAAAGATVALLLWLLFSGRV